MVMAFSVKFLAEVKTDLAEAKKYYLNIRRNFTFRRF